MDIVDPADFVFDLSGFEDFKEACHWLLKSPSERVVNADGYYCVRCAGRRRMLIYLLHRHMGGDRPGSDSVQHVSDGELGGPSLFVMTCVQCQTEYTAVTHVGPRGWELAIFSAERGGFTTPNTPAEVSFYLDQAHRAESVGAMSAAAGMYRSALEMLLFLHGYEERMLGPKISALLKNDSRTPAWRDRIDPEFLDAIKKIGDGAMHVNDGDISRQEAIDRETLGLARVVFEDLLDEIYERPAAMAARKQKLLNVGQSFKAPPKPTP